MPYTHTNSRGHTYVLHRRVTNPGTTGERTLHFFAREARGGAIDAVPHGYDVTESSRTGLPLLKKQG